MRAHLGHRFRAPGGLQKIGADQAVNVSAQAEATSERTSRRYAAHHALWLRADRGANCGSIAMGKHFP